MGHFGYHPKSDIGGATFFVGRTFVFVFAGFVGDDARMTEKLSLFHICQPLECPKNELGLGWGTRTQETYNSSTNVLSSGGLALFPDVIYKSQRTYIPEQPHQTTQTLLLDCSGPAHYCSDRCGNRIERHPDITDHIGSSNASTKFLTSAC